jgi:hypothetical protein
MDPLSNPKKRINNFRGLYRRGMADEVPLDHAIQCTNVVFNKRGEYNSRDGLTASVNLGHQVVRSFLATFNNSNLKLLTLDPTGNLYVDSSGSPVLSIFGMSDFAALNIYNRTYVLPFMTAGGPEYLYVWDGVNAFRRALGAAPSAAGPITCTVGAAGHIDVGTYKFAVSFITNTGFKTQPGVKVGGVFTPGVFVAPGGTKVNLSNIPTGPTGTVSRQILVTKGNLNQYYYAPGGLINDNVTTIATLDFFNSDLAVSADDLFDLLESIPAAGTYGWIDKYRGRMIVLGGEGDLVRVSNSGDPESFNSVNGYIQIQSEQDGNVVRGTMQLRDILYFTKSVGIYSIQENVGQPPALWGSPIPIDGGVGAISHGISSITGSQPNLSVNDAYVIADFAGLYLFNGTVQQPPLTWKIDDLWKQYVGVGNSGKVTVCINPFDELIYICVIGMSFILLGDYSEGFNADQIKWSMWQFPADVKSIGLFTYNDVDSFGYYLRVALIGINTMYKVQPGASNTDFGTAVQTTMQLGFTDLDTAGINVFRGIRIRCRRPNVGSNVNLLLTAFGEDNVTSINIPTISVPPIPGLEYFREFNFTGEKMSLLLKTANAGDAIAVQRVDFFGDKLWDMRPQ